MFEYKDYNDFIYDKKSGVWFIKFWNYIVFLAVAATIDDNDPVNDKPAYLSVLAHRSQMQVILDNAHLFDPSFVNAVYVLVRQYDTVQVDIVD